jgi:hypothetical protein
VSVLQARLGAAWRWGWLPALVAFAAWHAIFDVTLRQGMNEYLAAQDRHLAGRGPAVTIHGVMDAAERRGAWRGLAGAVPAFAAVVGVRGLIARRRRSG